MNQYALRRFDVLEQKLDALQKSIDALAARMPETPKPKKRGRPSKAEIAAREAEAAQQALRENGG